jgi:hypothetical protein
MDFDYAHVPSGSFDDEETNPADLDPTIDDCMRMWRQGIEWFKHDTVFGVRQFAGQEAGFENAALDLWVESVQRLRAAGLFDADTSYNLLHFIVETGLDYEAYDVDPQLDEIGDRMFALCQQYGLPEGTDFTPWPDPPPEWVALVREARAREQEMEYEVLRDAGEHEMVQLMIDAPDEFKRRVADVEVRLQRDHVAERDRWYPLSAEDKARLGIELSG